MDTFTKYFARDEEIRDEEIIDEVIKDKNIFSVIEKFLSKEDIRKNGTLSNDLRSNWLERHQKDQIVDMSKININKAKIILHDGDVTFYQNHLLI